MNKQVNDLLNCLNELSGLFESNTNQIRYGWKEEIDALYEAWEALENAENEDHVFVSVRGGVVTLVTDEAGEPIKNAHIIDYDNYDSGICPSCGCEFDDSQPCETCGYSASLDNGLESAIKYFTKE